MEHDSRIDDILSQTIRIHPRVADLSGSPLVLLNAVDNFLPLAVFDSLVELLDHAVNLLDASLRFSS